MERTSKRSLLALFVWVSALLPAPISARADELAATVTGVEPGTATLDGQTAWKVRAIKGVAGASFSPKTKAWDLSAFEGVTVTVRNPNPAAIVARLQASGDDSKGLLNACRTAVEVKPGETRTLSLRIIRRPQDPAFDRFKPFFMYVSAINIRDNTLDPAAVTKLTFEARGPDLGGGVELTMPRSAGVGRPAPVPFFPFVDTYGQYIHSDWPGKIYADSELAQRREEEDRERTQHAGPEDWDRYGGWAEGPTVKATGFFHAAKHDGKWWLVDPDGKLFWSYGPTGVSFGGDVTPVSDRESWFSDLPSREDSKLGVFYRQGRGATYKYYADKAWLGFDIQQANLLRKYGPDYQAAVARLSHDRLRSWGFNTMGNWSSPAIYALHRTPYTVSIDSPSVSMMRWKADGHSFQDVFDPRWEPGLRAAMEKQRGTTAGDPWCIGYFVDNERAVGWQSRAAVIGEMTLHAPSTQPCKAEFLSLIQAKYATIDRLNSAWQTTYASFSDLLKSDQPPSLKEHPKLLADCGDFGMLFCERYFSLCRSAVKAVAPDNMFLGSRFYGSTDPEVVALAGKYWDVISYNIYDNPPDGRVHQFAKLDLPMLCTEWGVESDPVQTPLRDAKELSPPPTERAEQIRQYVEHALRLPNLVGCHFFQFRDQPLSGRPDGEATLRGFVNVADTPNFELVEVNRALAARMYQARGEGK